MSNSPSPESELFQNLLEPLLEDFIYWFGKSHELVSSQKLDFMSNAEQSSLLARIENASKEVQAATMLYKIMGRQVGIDLATIAPWHSLLMECQSIGMRYRQNKAN